MRAYLYSTMSDKVSKLSQKASQAKQTMADKYAKSRYMGQAPEDEDETFDHLDANPNDLVKPTAQKLYTEEDSDSDNQQEEEEVKESSQQETTSSKKKWRLKRFRQPNKNAVHVEKEEVLTDPSKAPNKIMKSLIEKVNLEKLAHGRIRNHSIKLINELSKSKIDTKKLEMLSFQGIPDEVVGLRPIVWRVLLGFLPVSTSDWEATLEQQKQTYKLWLDELLVKPQLKDAEAIKDQSTKKKVIDHPLSTSTKSTWNQFFKDQDIWEEIEKDVKRTRVDLTFFYSAVDVTRNTEQDTKRLLMQAETKKSDLSPDDKQNYIDSHFDALARVLFIYAKLNPGVRYVQGMNEVLAVMYYCFYKQSTSDIIDQEFVESDVFFCFNSLMSEIRDGFVRDLDYEKSGIQGKVEQFQKLLKEVDPEVHTNLVNQGVNHQFYSLRWLMLLMCQEFDMSNCIRLWDSLFSDVQRFNFLNYVCVALVMLVRDQVVDGDFAQCMETLQSATEDLQDVRLLLNATNHICREVNDDPESDYYKMVDFHSHI